MSKTLIAATIAGTAIIGGIAYSLLRKRPGAIYGISFDDVPATATADDVVRALGYSAVRSATLTRGASGLNTRLEVEFESEATLPAIPPIGFQFKVADRTVTVTGAGSIRHADTSFFP